MIVACPKCHKQYRLDPKSVNYVKIPGIAELGVQLSCSNCNECWWETKPEDIDEKVTTELSIFTGVYQDLTDISNLFTNTSKFHIYKKEKRARYKLDSNKKLPLKYIVITIICFIILLTAGISILFIEHNQANHTISRQESNIENKAPPTKQQELIIKKIQYQINTNNNIKTIIVTGEVINPNDFAVPVPKIHILTYGKCTEHETEKDEEDGKCLIAKWLYEWEEDEKLDPGVTNLETSHTIPLESEIIAVDLDID